MASNVGLAFVRRRKRDPNLTRHSSLPILYSASALPALCRSGCLQPSMISHTLTRADMLFAIRAIFLSKVTRHLLNCLMREPGPKLLHGNEIRRANTLPFSVDFESEKEPKLLHFSNVF